MIWEERIANTHGAFLVLAGFKHSGMHFQECSEVGTIIILICQGSRLRHREVKKLSKITMVVVPGEVVRDNREGVTAVLRWWTPESCCGPFPSLK